MNLDDIIEMQIPRLTPIEIIRGPNASESKTEIKLIGYYYGVYGNNVESILIFDLKQDLTEEEIRNHPAYMTRRSIDVDRIISLTVLEPKK